MIDFIIDLWSRSLLWAFAVTTVVAIVRYLVLAGGAWCLLWQRGSPRYPATRLHAHVPDRTQLRRESLYSLMTCLLFPAFLFLVVFLDRFDLPLVYFFVSDRGWPYLLCSIAAALLLHDALFYWTHRLMHAPWFMRNIHFRHHQSASPTPWAALAFHPVEGFLQVLGIVIIVCVVPMHPIALSVFLLLNTAMNVFGHSGFEVLPEWFRASGVARFLSSPTLHGWHHYRGDKNFALYFTFWDHIMATTERPDFPPLPGEQQT